MGKTIAMYGDSTTWGDEWDAALGRYVTSPNSEPADVQALFPTATISNHGNPGATAMQQLLGINGVSGLADRRDWWQEMAKSPADVVVLNFGQNDCHRDPLFGQWLGVMIDIAQAAGKQVVVETPNPRTDQWAGALAGIAETAKGVAGAHGAAVVDQWSQLQAENGNWAFDLPDMVHPNDAMYAAKADNLAVALASAIGAVPAGYHVVDVGNFRVGNSSNILVQNDATGDIGRLDTDHGFSFHDVAGAAGWQAVGAADVDHSWTGDVVLHDPASGWDSALLLDYGGQATWQLLDWRP